MGDSLRQALVETLTRHQVQDHCRLETEGVALSWRCGCSAAGAHHLPWRGGPYDHAAEDNRLRQEMQGHVAQQLEYAVNRWLKEAGHDAAILS